MNKWDNILRHKYEKNWEVEYITFLDVIYIDIFILHQKKIYHDFKLIKYERIAFKMFIVV